MVRAVIAAPQLSGKPAPTKPWKQPTVRQSAPVSGNQMRRNTTTGYPKK